MKRSEDQQFLFETTVQQPVSECIRDMCAIHNLRERIGRLKMEGEELAKYGPAKEPSKQGLDEFEEEGDTPVERPPNYERDPTGRRTGDAPDAHCAEVLTKTLGEAHAACSKTLVASKQFLTEKALLEHIDLIRGAVMIAFPQGLPEWDPVRMGLEDDEDLGGSSAANEVLDPATTQLWWAGKQMNPDNKLSDHLGRNEKTKVVGKLQKKGGGAPAREPQVSADEHKEMLAYYFKKQEEQKAFEQNEDDDYLNSSWANPKSLKGHFSGVGDVKTPMGGGSFNGGMF